MKPIAIVLGISLVSGGAYAQTPQTKDPNQQVIAVVLGKNITARDKDHLVGLVFGTLLEQFARKHNIEPTEEELDTFITKTDEKQKQQQLEFEEKRKKLKAELQNTSMSASERKKKESRLQQTESILKAFGEVREGTRGMGDQLRQMKRNSARQFVQRWKINKKLYETYGGRVIFQQGGPEPVDAYRDFLREQEKKGAFEILDKKYEPVFWRYFTNDAMHTFYPKGEGEKFINTPWWTMDQQQKQ